MEGVVLRGHLIVMPQALRDRTLAIAHQGHQGVVKTKQLLRTKAWWPKIDQHVESLIKNCLAWQSVAPPNPTTPLCETEMPSKPWSSLHMDLCGPFPSGESVLVVIDAYSRFPEVDILKSTTAPSIINKLDRTFSTHGFPDSVTSDNGPQFACHEMADYFSQRGIKHHHVTPLWPQANGLVESFMKPLNKTIRTARAQGQVWQKELPKFLLNYRTTPHTTTKVAPVQLLFNRVVNNGIPAIAKPNLHPVPTQEHAKSQLCDAELKKKSKMYADIRRHEKETHIKVGDIVLLKQPKENKLSTRFSPKPYQVVAMKGHMVPGLVVATKSLGTLHFPKSSREKWIRNQLKMMYQKIRTRRRHTVMHQKKRNHLKGDIQYEIGVKHLSMKLFKEYRRLRHKHFREVMTIGFVEFCLI